MSLFEAIASLINVTVENVYIYRWICVHGCVEVAVDRLLVFMQQVCRKLVFELGHDWIEDFKDAIKIHFCPCTTLVSPNTAVVAEIYEHRSLKCVFLRFF